MESSGSMARLAVTLLIIGVAVLPAGYIIKKIRRMKRAISASGELALLRYAAKAIQSGELQETLSGTPKSVSAMDRIYLPQIQRDFPEFNWNEFKAVIEDAIVSFLTAVDERRPELVKAHERLLILVQNQLRQENIFHYKNIRTHRTVIKNYIKKSGTCAVLSETSVEYDTDEPEQKRGGQPGRMRKKQAVYETELVYVQDSVRFGAGSGAALQCPNCGAPVKNLGIKYCEYCRTAIEPLNMRVWRINSLREG